MNRFRLRLFILIFTFGFGASSAKAIVCEDIFELTPFSAKAWLDISERAELSFQRFSQYMQMNIAMGVETRTQYYERMGKDTYFSDLGFDFESGTAPSLVEFLMKLEQLREKRLAEWNRDHPEDQISADELIDPAFPFYDSKNNRWMVAAYGQNIEEGFTHESEKLIPGRALYPSLAYGYFPIMVPWPGLISSDNVPLYAELFIHDVLSHQLGYLSNPDYARSYRWMAGQVAELGGWGEIKKRKDLYARIYYFNEYFVTTDAKKIDEDWSIFVLPNKPQKRDDRFYNVLEVEAELHKLDYRQIWDLFIKLREHYPHMARITGGIANDFDSNGYNVHILGELFASLELLMIQDPDNIEQRDIAHYKDVLIRLIAQYQTRLLGLANFTTHEWAQESFKATLSKDSKMYQFFFGTGILEGYERMDWLESMYLPDPYSGFLDWPVAE